MILDPRTCLDLQLGRDSTTSSAAVISLDIGAGSNPEGVNQNRYLYDSWTLGLITSSVLQLEMHVYSLSYSIWSLSLKLL
jgi:hypothetical protein